ncbi:hypothetical protein QBC41DRAFT_137756 [Cercophora samala]|uniref:Uncharacterized protein n=1 Tax=Cercophora samala TaxID=330535 RepID=A0AA39ZAS4_9PEZI|nr:hypothetical protein QBC41DRAFT_137756 [Cercophora samala]
MSVPAARRQENENRQSGFVCVCVRVSPPRLSIQMSVLTICFPLVCFVYGWSGVCGGGGLCFFSLLNYFSGICTVDDVSLVCMLQKKKKRRIFLAHMLTCSPAQSLTTSSSLPLPVVSDSGGFISSGCRVSQPV